MRTTYMIYNIGGGGGEKPNNIREGDQKKKKQKNSINISCLKKYIIFKNFKI